MDKVPLLASLWYNGQLASAPPSSYTLKHVSAPHVPLLLMYLIFQMFNCSKISSLTCSILSCFYSLLYKICRFMKVLLLPFGIADPPHEGCSLSITQPFRVCTALAYKSSNLPTIEQILCAAHIESHERRLAGQSMRTPADQRATSRAEAMLCTCSRKCYVLIPFSDSIYFRKLGLAP
jgi:hypothetical protein